MSHQQELEMLKMFGQYPHQISKIRWPGFQTGTINWGDDVDVAAPGVNVKSYYKNDQLANLNGTSMAAPGSLDC